MQAEGVPNAFSGLQFDTTIFVFTLGASWQLFEPELSTRGRYLRWLK